MSMAASESELNSILDMITSMASLDFSRKILPIGKNDEIAAIAEGLNMLSEELITNLVDKAELTKVNRKLSKFAYTTAHDLKSPLNSTAGLIHLIELSINQGDTSELQLHLSKLKKINAHMKDLVIGILDYSKAHSSNDLDQIVDFNEVLHHVIDLDNVRSYADIEVKQSLPTILFNKTAAIQLIRNLIDNAIKYCDKPRCKIHITCLEMEKAFQIAFEDNGPGIATHYQEKIFDLFNQMDYQETRNSVGIGLATIKNIVEAEGGKIWIQSEEGKGASFIFTLIK